MLTHSSNMTLVLYGGIAAIAGFIDTLAGGGGLVTVPALLLGGMPPLQALGTNKLQGVCGALVATASLIRRSTLNLKSVVLPFVAALAGGTLGAFLVRNIDSRALDFIIPIVLIGIAFYFLLAPKAGEVERHPRVTERLYAVTVLPLIGFYDGFFGPGTGAFYALSGVSLRGWDLIRATASAKLFNFSSSLASLFVFIYGGEVVWLLGTAMICGQVVGARLGSFVVVRGGAKIIRPMIVIVSVVMLTRYIWQKINFS